MKTRQNAPMTKCVALMALYFIFAMLMGLSCSERRDFYSITHYLSSLRSDEEVIQYVEIRSVNSIVDEEGNTILHHAAMLKDKEAYRLLMDKGANPFLKNNEGQTAFEIYHAKER